MKKIKKIILAVLILIIIVLIVLLLYKKFYNKEDKSEVKVIKTISNYGYNLDENETKIYKDEFNNLDEILSNNSVNYEEYAKSIAKLFIIDFYTLNNKLSKNDIGGTEFIEPTIRDNFIEQARSTFYRYIEVKTDKRNQKLPEVSKIDNIKLENTTFIIKDMTTTTTKKGSRTSSSKGTAVDAYKVTISWSYEEDLGYETDAKMIIIRKDDKLYIAEMD